MKPIHSQLISADIVETTRSHLAAVMCKAEHIKNSSVCAKSCKYYKALSMLAYRPHHRGRKHLTAKRKLLNELDVINHSLNTTIDHTRLQKADSRVTLSGRQHMVGPADKTPEERHNMWQLLQTRHSANPGQNTDPSLPFTKTVWTYEREREHWRV